MNKRCAYDYLRPCDSECASFDKVEQQPRWDPTRPEGEQTVIKYIYECARGNFTISQEGEE